MKKTIQTIFVSLMAVLMIASFAHASFNSPGQMPTITVTNASVNPCPEETIQGCWQRSTTARPGDVIAVHVYYKNTGSQPEQAYIDLKPSRSGTHVQFSGGVNSAGGTATVELSSATTIAYLTGSDRACWTVERSPCREVNADALFGNGFSIGTVQPGEQGTLVARFLVGAGQATDNDDDDDDNDNDDDECYINSFTASDYDIEEGDSTTLRWNTTDCDYVRITSISGNLNEDDDVSVRPSSDKTYTLTAYPGGDTETVHINVDEDDDNDDDDECRIDTFKANDYSIERGDKATITWKVTGADDVDITPGYSNRNKSGTLSVYPTSTTTYRINVSGNGCSDSESFTISVENDNNSRPQAITTVASILSSNSAQLNGIAVPNTNSGSTSAWFEWGPTTNVQYRTSSKSVGSGSGSTPYSDTISGIVGGTTYYYRAVVQNSNGTAYGDIVPFRSQNSVAGTTVVTGPTRVIVQTVRDSVTAQSAASLLELRVESAYDHMCIGGEMEYVVTYRNISAITLEDTVLRLALPKELTYAGADRGTFDPIDRILTLDIGRVQPGEQGTVTVRARVNENAIRGNLTVMTATVVYTNPNTRAQEDAIAYSLITVSDECPTVLGASVFGFGSFLPDTLLEWLLLILVILALILLGRNLYKKKEEQK